MEITPGFVKVTSIVDDYDTQRIEDLNTKKPT